MDKHRQCIADGECAPRHRAKAKSSRWCGGHVGRLHHVWAWRLDDVWHRTWFREPGYMRYRRVCIQCGKMTFDIRLYCRNCHTWLGKQKCVWFLFAGELVKPCPHCGENLL
jgi:hypothetical protein